uniref:Septum-promoting GTP-binding protein 1 n=1 Tax=Leersia perrieri TaxID=77586 RepID=A0A0D9WZK7_9ORYZ
MTTTVAMDVTKAVTQLGGGGGGGGRRRGNRPAVLRLDLRWGRLLRLAVISRVVRLVSLLGDCQIGKTSFMVKYVGDEEEHNGLQMTGLNLMDKTLAVRGARIAFSIWDVAGDSQFLDHVPIACKDAVAILYMFDLTSRCTLTNIIDWYERARKWNKTAIPILIGTKFDDFVQLPLEMQWTIVNEARAYARAMKATLFFSSSTHNINVNKIFKFITAKLFNLPWTVERNLTVGEPIIDF